MSDWPKPMPVVEVEWIDSNATSGWQDVEDAKACEAGNCRSAGYLLRRNKTFVALVQNMSDGGHADMVMSIPRSCVKTITVLKKARRR